MKKIFNSQNLVRFIFLTFVASTIYVAARMIIAPSGPVSDPNTMVKGDYTLMLLQCVLGMGIMLLPGILERRAKLVLPSGMVIAFAVFLFCAIYLGEVHNFYFRIQHWDTMLHTFSGAALGALGLSIIGLLNNSKSVKLSLSPGFVALFAFCFAVAAGVVWEIYEFAMDAFISTNMQKFVTESGEILIGQAALMDTMKDLIVDSLGALIVSIVGYMSMKSKDGWLEKMQLRIRQPAPAPQPAAAASLAEEPAMPVPQMQLAAKLQEEKLTA